MGMRKYYRSIAKARLAEMGVTKVNTKLGMGISNSLNRKMQRTSQGKRKLADIWKARKPVWRRVLWGDLAGMYLADKRKADRRRGRLQAKTAK